MLRLRWLFDIKSVFQREKTKFRISRLNLFECRCKIKIISEKSDLQVFNFKPLRGHVIRNTFMRNVKGQKIRRLGKSWQCFDLRGNYFLISSKKISLQSKNIKEKKFFGPLEKWASSNLFEALHNIRRGWALSEAVGQRWAELGRFATILSRNERFRLKNFF